MWILFTEWIGLEYNIISIWENTESIKGTIERAGTDTFARV